MLEAKPPLNLLAKNGSEAALAKLKLERKPWWSFAKSGSLGLREIATMVRYEVGGRSWALSDLLCPPCEQSLVSNAERFYRFWFNTRLHTKGHPSSRYSFRNLANSSQAPSPPSRTP